MCLSIKDHREAIYIIDSFSLTHSLTEMSPSSEAANCAAMQEIPEFYKS
jgi:hypothetical protein